MVTVIENELEKLNTEMRCKPGNIWDLFHKAWGQAKASPEYDKDVWMKLEKEVVRYQARLYQEMKKFSSADQKLSAIRVAFGLPA